MKAITIGTYNSSMFRIAGILHRLGVLLGMRKFAIEKSPICAYRDPLLKEAIMKWFPLPDMSDEASRAERHGFFTEWAMYAEMESEHYALSHPMLSLCVDDVIAAWGDDTKVIYCYVRPELLFTESHFEALRFQMHWSRRWVCKIESKLWAESADAALNHDAIFVESRRYVDDPLGHVLRLIDDLGIEPTQEQIDEAVKIAAYVPIQPHWRKKEKELVHAH